ncbi:MAG: LOG family protein [candidate division Zixibacteria bacterium]|nr:LOG family protein [candidate division Zixibacteria bacterium]
MKKKLTPAQMSKRLGQSSAYRIAYKDHDFLDSGYARPARLQLELLKPETILRREGIASTIVCFGGTRIVEPKEARAELRKIENKLKHRPSDKELRRQMRVAKSVLAKSRFYDEAREFARLVSIESQGNDNHEYVIVTGGGPGIMEAANRGAYDIGAKSIGLNITLPMEQEPNAYITPELCMQFHYFAIRKMHFMLRAKALVAFPGGYGTLDELFEGLTLVQTKKIKPLPVILFGEKFWKGFIDFEYLAKQGTIDPEDLKLFVYADHAADAWDYIKYFYQGE